MDDTSDNRTGDSGGNNTVRYFPEDNREQYVIPYISEVINDEEMEELKKRNTKLTAIRIICAIVGLVIMGISAYVFTGIRIPEFYIDISGYKFELIYPLALLTSYIGVFIFTRFVTIGDSRLKESVPFITAFSKVPEKPTALISFFNLSIPRLAGAVLFLILAYLSFDILGYGISHENEFGSWMILGGPSWGYPLGLLSGFAGILTLAGFLLTFKKVRIYSSPNFYYIYEIKFPLPVMTEIPKKDIREIQLNNCRYSYHWLWAALIVIFLVLLKTGMALMKVPFKADNTVAIMITTVSVLGIILVMSVLLLQPHYLTITADKNEYKLIFAPVKQKSSINAMATFFDLDIPPKSEVIEKIREGNGKNLGADIDGIKIRDTIKPDENTEILYGTAMSFYRLALGGVIFGFGVYSYYLGMFIGQPLNFLFMFYGSVQILKGFKQDFSGPKSAAILIDRNTRTVKQKRTFIHSYEYRRINNVIFGYKKTDFMYTLPVLDPIEKLTVFLMAFFVVREWTFQIIVWAPWIIDIRNIPTELIELYTFIVIFAFNVRPIDSLRVMAEDLPEIRIQMENIFRELNPQRIRNLAERNKFRTLYGLKGREEIFYYRKKVWGSYASNKKEIYMRLVTLFLLPGFGSMFLHVLWVLQYRWGFELFPFIIR